MVYVWLLSRLGVNSDAGEKGIAIDGSIAVKEKVYTYMYNGL